MRSKNSPRRPSRIEYVIASITPASAKSGTTRGPRCGWTAGLRWSRAGGIERAGVTRTGRGGATCFVGRGDGIGSARATRACVLRAGVVARARLIAVFLELLLRDELLRRDGAPDERRLLAWVLFRAEGFRDRERDEDARLGRVAFFFVRPDFTGVPLRSGRKELRGLWPDHRKHSIKAAPWPTTFLWQRPPGMCH